VPLRIWTASLAGAALLLLAGCAALLDATDRDIADAIAARQRQALGYDRPTRPAREDGAAVRPGPQAYERTPAPVTQDLPEAFLVPAASQPATTQPFDDADADTRPARFRERVFTLTDAFAYAQVHRRELQSAKEDLYLTALALSLERHLWTPQFAAEARTVYGNFGEITDFDQAMRFVADLSVAQRLPYGGDFTARMVSTLIRDVGRSITATEGGTIDLGLNVPLLRGAGHVAREDLYQLERELTYAVRSYERFRRDQLVDVAEGYFNLLQLKQAVRDAHTSLRNARDDVDRARGFQDTGQGSPLDTQRAEQRLLEQQNSLARVRESFRFSTDQFKLLIGMPVDQPMGLDDLESITDIERQIVEGAYPLLRRPQAASDEALALDVATRSRLDLLTSNDRVDDAKRGVDIARNALLPDLDWTSSLAFDTDPQHYRVGGYEFARAAWRSEVVLAMNDRFAEKNRYRASIIDVRQAQRNYTDQMERVRVGVRQSVNQIELQERIVRIQEEAVKVATRQSEFARIQYEEGLIDNRDKVEAEDALIQALNSLNQAKTDLWSALLGFRLSTGTMRVDEHGDQQPDPDLDA